MRDRNRGAGADGSASAAAPASGRKFPEKPMSDFKHKEEERLSRQQAAERLIDIAYALTAGGPIELKAHGPRTTVPVANDLRLERELRSKGDQVKLALELSWSAANGSGPD